MRTTNGAPQVHKLPAIETDLTLEDLISEEDPHKLYVDMQKIGQGAFG